MEGSQKFARVATFEKRFPPRFYGDFCIMNAGSVEGKQRSMQSWFWLGLTRPNATISPGKSLRLKNGKSSSKIHFGLLKPVRSKFGHEWFGVVFVGYWRGASNKIIDWEKHWKCQFLIPSSLRQPNQDFLLNTLARQPGKETRPRRLVVMREVC